MSSLVSTRWRETVNGRSKKRPAAPAAVAEATRKEAAKLRAFCLEVVPKWLMGLVSGEPTGFQFRPALVRIREPAARHLRQRSTPKTVYL